MATNVPDIQFTSTGLVLPLESAILAGVQQDQNAAFGGNLNPDLSTPQGQLAQSEAAIIGDKNDIIAQYVNQVDPAFASGRMQDAIGRIYFLDRKPAQPTVVQCLCTGQATTPIPAGSLALDTANNLYLATTGGTIGAFGTVTLEFQAQTPGPIVVGANQLNRIYTAIPGWDSINNLSNGVIGSNVESRADFEFRRQQSVALNARGSLPSIYAAVFDVPNVLDVYVTENVTSAMAIDGATNYPLVPHSLYVAATGGDPNAIAQAIWNKKDVGCDYNGNTSIIVNDTSGYNPPYPTYTVKFNIPTPTAIAFQVSIHGNPNLPVGIVGQIQATILSAFNGGDGGSRARIGSTIAAGRYYCPLADLSVFLSIAALTLGVVGGTQSTQVVMGIDQQPTLSLGNITVTIVP